MAWIMAPQTYFRATALITIILITCLLTLLTCGPTSQHSQHFCFLDFSPQNENAACLFITLISILAIPMTLCYFFGQIILTIQNTFLLYLSSFLTRLPWPSTATRMHKTLLQFPPSSVLQDVPCNGNNFMWAISVQTLANPKTSTLILQCTHRKNYSATLDLMISSKYSLGPTEVLVPIHRFHLTHHILSCHKGAQ